jgi:hypothetical protein
VGVEPPPTATCPVCGNPVAACTCAGPGPDGGGPGGGPGGPPPARLHAEGAPAQAFQQLMDQCSDQGVHALRRLVIRVEGSGRTGAADARALGLAIPQLGRGEFFVEQQMGAEFGAGEQFSLTFAGGWDRYKRVKPLTDAFGQEASKVTVCTVLRAEFPEGLAVASEQFQGMRDVFTALGLGKLVLDAEPATAEEGVRR